MGLMDKRGSQNEARAGQTQEKDQELMKNVHQSVENQDQNLNGEAALWTRLLTSYNPHNLLVSPVKNGRANFQLLRLVFCRNFCPQAPAGFFTPVANGEGYDLPGSTAHDRPQPAFITFFSTKHQASPNSSTSPGSAGNRLVRNDGKSWTCSRTQIAIEVTAFAVILLLPIRFLPFLTMFSLPQLRHV
jgi:hypothetical protein